LTRFAFVSPFLLSFPCCWQVQTIGQLAALPISRLGAFSAPLRSRLRFFKVSDCPKNTLNCPKSSSKSAARSKRKHEQSPGPPVSYSDPKP
jgi:hypothetical protein